MTCSRANIFIVTLKKTLKKTAELAIPSVFKSLLNRLVDFAYLATNSDWLFN